MVPPRRCSLLLVAFLWTVGRAEVAQSGRQRLSDAFDAPGSEQLLRLIVHDVTDQIQPLVSKLATRIEGFDARLISFGSRLDGIETRLSALDFKHDSVDARLDELASRVDGLVSADRRRNSQYNELSSRLDELAGRVDQGHADSRASSLPRDCSELPEGAQSGIHSLRLGADRSGPEVAAYCDLDADGGGWTVIQRRQDVQPRQYFERNWAAYREGFGELDSEFWWGLEKLWKITGPEDRRYQLRVDLEDFEGERRYAEYEQFRVASGANGYRLTVGDYSGNAGDSMKNQNGMKFSTIDRDQDGHNTKHCAEIFNGGWWFDDCYLGFLNGLYLLGEQSRTEGINWGTWKHYNYSLKESEMKIRPVNLN